MRRGYIFIFQVGKREEYLGIREEGYFCMSKNGEVCRIQSNLGNIVRLEFRVRDGRVGEVSRSQVMMGFVLLVEVFIDDGGIVFVNRVVKLLDRGLERVMVVVWKVNKRVVRI